MYIQNKYASALFKTIISLCALCGILIQCGVFEGRFYADSLRYYTLMSNLLCALYFGAAAAFALRGRGRILPTCKGALVMGITVTGLVYNFMLSGRGFSMGGAMSLANVLLHNLVPVLCVLDWLLFDEKGLYTLLSPLKWLILPDLYFLFCVVYAAAGGMPFAGGSRYPYFFIDFDMLGTGRVLLYVVALNVFFAALGYLYYLIDRLLYRSALRRG